MLLKFKAGPDKNGNMRFIGIDTEKKVFSTDSRETYPDAIIVTRSVIIALKEQCYSAGYTRIDFI